SAAPRTTAPGSAPGRRPPRRPTGLGAAPAAPPRGWWSPRSGRSPSPRAPPPRAPRAPPAAHPGAAPLTTRSPPAGARAAGPRDAEGVRRPAHLRRVRLALRLQPLLELRRKILVVLRQALAQPGHETPALLREGAELPHGAQLLGHRRGA